jgi:DNA-binding NarL/FixJ family response regulator
MCRSAVRAILGCVSLRCLIVDDSPGFREAMRALLEAQELDVVGGAGSAAEGLQQIAELRPDVALIDIDLGVEDGLTLARRVRDSAVDGVPKVILISTHDESEFADLIEATSAAGFISKTELTAAAIRRMLAGQAGL